MNADTVVGWILGNIPFIVLAILFVFKVCIGTKKGFAKELCSFVSMILASIAILLIAFAIKEYLGKERLQLVITIVLILLLGLIYKVLDMFFSSLKLIAKLPVIRLLNTLLGMVMGALEPIIFIWAVYCVVIILGAGSFGDLIMNNVNNNRIMKVLFEYNYLYPMVSGFSDGIRNLWNKLISK